MHVTRLQRLATAPPVFEPGESLFWDDPYISTQMLAAHLDPDTDAASRRPETIARTVSWIVEHLGLEGGGRVLDLGCGPGLYAEQLAAKGLRVTGIDYSQRSIAYATGRAAEQGLEVEYRYQDYLTLDEPAIYDAVLLIYGDLCPLAPGQRDALLVRILGALKPGGCFVFDVTTPTLRRREGLKNHWYAAQSGFWRPGPHLVLEQGFEYPEQAAYLDQYIVVEGDDTISVYRNWFVDYTLETIAAVLERQGYTLHSYWSDLTGTPYAADADWIGVVARKAAPR